MFDILTVGNALKCILCQSKWRDRDYFLLASLAGASLRRFVPGPQGGLEKLSAALPANHDGQRPSWETCTLITSAKTSSVIKRIIYLYLEIKISNYSHWYETPDPRGPKRYSIVQMVPRDKIPLYSQRHIFFCLLTPTTRLKEASKIDDTRRR